MTSEQLYFNLLASLAGMSISIAIFSMVGAFIIQQYGKQAFFALRWIYRKVRRQKTETLPNKLDVVFFVLMFLPFTYCMGLTIIAALSQSGK